MSRLLRASLPLLLVRPGFCPCFSYPLGCAEWVHDYRDSARDEGPFWSFLRVVAFLAQLLLVAGLHWRLVVFSARGTKAVLRACRRAYGKGVFGIFISRVSDALRGILGGFHLFEKLRQKLCLDESCVKSCV